MGQKESKTEVIRIAGKQCNTTRSLWEEVFYEDSVEFTDYYFKCKAEDNIGYVIGEEPYNAMMFCTPYKVQIGQEQKELSYIVGVATRKEYRHRGYMSALLKSAFTEMYQKKQPFTFLMPASPAIYEPFDFRYIYERDVWKLKQPIGQSEWLEQLTRKDGNWQFEGKLQAAEESHSGIYRLHLKEESNVRKNTGTRKEASGLYSVRQLCEEAQERSVFRQLADFANEYLKQHFSVFVCRDEAYYRRQLKESKAQNGDIYVLYEQGEIQAFFLYAKEEEEIFLQEVMEKEEGILDFLQKEETKKPVIMARVIHVEEMLKLICSKEEKTLLVEIEDNIIMENNGIFRLKMTAQGSLVTRLQEYQTPEEKWRVGELAPRILKQVCINEIV